MRFHVLALPHAATTAAFVGCAFTSNVVKFCTMMRSLGHEVYLYASEENEAQVTEHIPLVSTTEREEWYGPDDPNTMPSRATWDPNDASWQTMNGRAIAEIGKRAEEGDFLCLLNGWCQQIVARTLTQLTAVEFNAGYEHFTLDRCCFPSYTFMHYLYGKNGVHDGRWDDVVIPHPFNPDDFHLAEKGDYLLYLGRMIRRKGIQLAAEIADKAGMKLVMAGQGVTSVEPGVIHTEECDVVGDHVSYLGPVGATERAFLMARAKAVLMPTLYIEMFGCVAVEAQLSGTAVVTTDWGAFPEVNAAEYRFRTVPQALECVERAVSLSTAEQAQLREDALARFSADVVRHQYAAWFSRLQSARAT